MNSIVERLRGFKSAAAQVWAYEAADLIEQQAERIKELEAELVAMTKDRDTWKGECLDGTVTKQLAALRQRIADAPVVAEVEKERGLTYGNRGAAAVGTKLISKEDLK